MLANITSASQVASLTENSSGGESANSAEPGRMFRRIQAVQCRMTGSESDGTLCGCVHRRTLAVQGNGVLARRLGLGYSRLDRRLRSALILVAFSPSFHKIVMVCHKQPCSPVESRVPHHLTRPRHTRMRRNCMSASHITHGTVRCAQEESPVSILWGKNAVEEWGRV
jgi:hypothetical protein